MGSDLRLPKALDASGNLISAEIVGIDAPKDQQFKCPGCFILVGHVFGSDGHRKSRPYFRKKAETSHANNCKFNADEVKKAILREACGYVIRREKVLQLKIPAVNTFADLSENKQPKAGNLKMATSYKSLPSKDLRPIIASAVRIVKFLKAYDFSEEAVEAFAILYNGKAISWQDFCLTDKDQIADLFDHIAGESKKAFSHPRAIYGKVTKKGERVSSGGKQLFFAQCDFPEKVYINGIGKYLRVVMRTRHPHLLDRIKEGENFLALGKWGNFTGDRASRFELVLWINEPWQIAGWVDSSS